MGTTRKNLSGCTIFLLLYAWKKISDMIPQEIPEPTRTKMIDKKLDELLKTRNKASILKMPRTRPKPAAGSRFPHSFCRCFGASRAREAKMFYATKGSITTPLECDNRGKKTRDKVRNVAALLLL
ncbi:hypothetical protein Tco_1258473, partial [Tanacetum coccineum]